MTATPPRGLTLRCEAHPDKSARLADGSCYWCWASAFAARNADLKALAAIDDRHNNRHRDTSPLVAEKPLSIPRPLQEFRRVVEKAAKS